MEPSTRCALRKGTRWIRARKALLAAPALFLLALPPFLPFPPAAAAEGGKTPTFEERAEAEKISRSRYRDLEVASLVIILVAGGAAVLWAIRRRKP